MNDNDKLNYLNKHTIYPQEISLLENFTNFMDIDSSDTHMCGVDWDDRKIYLSLLHNL